MGQQCCSNNVIKSDNDAFTSKLSVARLTKTFVVKTSFVPLQFFVHMLHECSLYIGFYSF